MAIRCNFRLLLLVVFFGATLAGPIHQHEPSMCKTECLLTDSRFTSGMSYVYKYKGRSDVVLKGVQPHAVSSFDLMADVWISFENPCQLSIQVKDPIINGKKDPIMEELLTRKSMTASITNGVVSTVCADPDDHPTGLNLKKGIVSAFQNVIPSFSPIVVNKTFYEMDVLGICPTTYSVRNNLFSLVVTKVKNQKTCTHQYATADESPVTSWRLRSPISMIDETRSECEQVIRQSDRVVLSVSCRDVKSIQITGTNLMITNQTSLLTLKDTYDSIMVPPLKKARYTNLTFEVIPQPKSQELVPVLKNHLKQLCKSIENKVEKDSAKIYEKVIGYMYRIPEKSIKGILEEIRKGEFCQKYHRLESLYLDAIAFIDNGGAVELMVDQVVSGKVSGGRTPLYTLALFLTKKPCIHSVKAVSPLFDSEKAPSSMVLAAGTLVRKYCRFHENCLKDEPIKEIFQKLSKTIESSCSTSSNDQTKKTKVLTALKAIGNIANISHPLGHTVMKCIQARRADTFVRVAAAQAFRHVSCHCQPTSDLVKMATSEGENPEVRIASYMAAIPCASYEEDEAIVSKISKEANTQVRAFILSHLRNMQESDAPYLKGIRYNLSSLIIPSDYDKDIRKYSKHSDHSYYLTSLGLGAGMDSSVIYAPGSYIPRHLQSNFTVNLFDSVINVGELGLRLEDFESILDTVFGPGSYFQNEAKSKIAQDILDGIKNKGKEIKGHLHNILKDLDGQLNSSIDISKIMSIFTTSKISRLPKVDAFVRIFGQEVAFTSLSVNLKKMNEEEVMGKLLEVVVKAFMDTSSSKMKAARGVQLNYEYFVPTIQGIPVQFKTVATTVTALDDNSNPDSPKSKYNFSPAFSFALNIFAGYSMGVKAGVRAKIEAFVDPRNSLQVEMKNEQLEVVLDMPSNIQLLSGNYSGYTMVKMPAQVDEKTAPEKGYPVIRMKECADPPEEFAGLKICYDMEMPRYEEVKLAPLGDIWISMNATKMNPEKEVMRLKSVMKFEKNIKSIDLELEAPGSPSRKKGEIELEYKRAKGMSSIKAYGKCGGRERSMQINMKSRKSSTATLLNVNLFFGQKKTVSASDQVLTVKMKEEKKANEAETEFDLKTKKALAKYIDMDIEVDIASKLSKSGSVESTQIKKLEANMNIPGIINTTNYIRKGDSTQPLNYDYRLLSLTKTPSTLLLKVEGSSNSSGEWSKLTHKCHTHLLVKTPQNQVECHAQVILTRSHKQAVFSIRRPDTNRYYVLANATLHKDSPSSPSYVTKVEVRAPDFIRSYKVDGSIHSPAKNQYNVNLDVKREDENLYKIEGPVNVEKSKSHFKERSQLKLTSIQNSLEYLLKTSLLLSPSKKDAMVALKMDNVPVFTVEGELEREGSITSTSVGLTVPKMIDGKVKARKSSEIMQLVLDGYLKPNTLESQRLKGSSSLDLSKKKLMASLAYDLEKDPKKKVELNTAYDYSLEQKFASVKGDLVLCSEKYSYSAESILGSYASKPNDRNSVKFMVRKPDGGEFIVESRCAIKRQSSTTAMSVYTMVQSGRNHVHKVEGKYSYDFNSAPYKMFLKGETKVESPIVKNIDIHLDSEVDINDKNHLGHWKMQITGANLPSPINTSIEIANREKSLMAKANLDLGSSSSFRVRGNTNLTRNEKYKIEDVSMDVSILVSQDTDYRIKAEKKKQLVDFSLSINGKKVLALEQSNSKPGVWWARLMTPLRIVETESTLSENQASLTIYPNRRVSDDKYNIHGHYLRSDSYSGSKLEGGASVTHPYSENSLSIQTNILMRGASSQGTLEIDVFNKPEDKVIVDVRAWKLGALSMKLEADVKVPSQDVVPRIEMETAISPEVKSFEILLKRSPTDEPSYKALMSFNHPVRRSKNLYVFIKTPSETIAMISNLHMHEMLRCRGTTMNGTVVSEKYGSYDFQSAICVPGYMEFGVKKGSDDKIYMAKVGMKDPSSIKVALDLVYNSSEAITSESVRKIESTMNLYGRHEYLPKIPIVLVGAQLWASKTMTFDAYYNCTGVTEYMETVIKPGMKGIESLSKELGSELQSEFKENLFPKLPDLSPELKKELSEIFNKITDEISAVLKELKVNLPSMDEVAETISAVVTKAWEMYEKVRDNVEVVIANTFNVKYTDIHRILKDYDRQLQEVMVKLYKEAKQIWSAVWEGPEAMMRIPSLKVLVEKLEGSSIFDWFKRQVEKIKKTIVNDWKATLHFFRHYMTVLKDDIKKFYQKITHSHFVQKMIKWIESLLFEEVKEEESSLLALIGKRFYSFYLTSKEGFIRWQMPLRKSVSSLSAAFPSIGVSLPSGHTIKSFTDFSYLLKKVAGTHYSWAALKKDKVYSFDGLIMPAIHSECQILFAEVFGDQIVGTVKSKKKTDVLFQLENGKTFYIYLEKGKDPRVSGLDLSGAIRTPEMNATRHTHKVYVELKGLSVTAESNTLDVVAKPGAYSKLYGLFGNYDHEIGNDAHRKAEITYKPNSLHRHHANTETAKRIFNQYRVDKSCVIP